MSDKYIGNKQCIKEIEKILKYEDETHYWKLIAILETIVPDWKGSISKDEWWKIVDVLHEIDEEHYLASK